MNMVVPQIDERICLTCEECVLVCPHDAATIVEGRLMIVKPEECDYCTECERLCPKGAIRCPFEIRYVSENRS